MSVFKIPFSLSVLVPNASFLRDFNDQNFFAYSFFLGLSGSGLSVSKENILEIYMFPICISDDLLNMYSEPFVMVLNVRAA